MSMPPGTSAPMAQLLEWIGAQPRSYAELMASWRSSCPRLTIWEDALNAGLVEVVGRRAVRLTEHGRHQLQDERVTTGAGDPRR